MNGIGLGVFEQVAIGELWGFSLGGNGVPEVSLTDRPAYASSRVVGCGPAALTAWELLTGTPAIDPAASGAPQVNLGRTDPGCERQRHGVQYRRIDGDERSLSLPQRLTSAPRAWPSP